MTADVTEENLTLVLSAYTNAEGYVMTGAGSNTTLFRFETLIFVDLWLQQERLKKFKHFIEIPVSISEFKRLMSD